METIQPTEEQATIARLYLAEKARAEDFKRHGDSHQAALARVRAVGWAFELAESIARPIVAATPKLGLAVFTPKTNPPPVPIEVVDEDETRIRKSAHDADRQLGVGCEERVERRASR